MNVRIYPDTSVFGGMLDLEFREPTSAFFAMVDRGDLAIVLSPVVEEEVVNAPEAVRDLFASVAVGAEWISVTEEALALRDAYIEAGVLTQKWSADALHVALASVAGCDLIVSWNFRHIVHFQKVPKYNAVNILKGYGEVGIYTPQEVMTYE